MVNSSQKEIQEALTKRLIPWGTRGELQPLLARIPLEIPASAGVIKIAQPFLTKPEQHPYALNPDRWPHLHLHACRYPCLSVVLEGEADILLGITKARAAR